MQLLLSMMRASSCPRKLYVNVNIEVADQKKTLTIFDDILKATLGELDDQSVENIECDVTPSDWPNTMVCVHYCWISCLLHQTSGVLVSKTPLHVGGHVLCCSAILYVLLLCAE